MIGVRLLGLLLIGCAPYGYLDPTGPRYAGEARESQDPDPRIHVVSFNIEHAREIDRAIEALRSHRSLRGADILLLQEMDADGTRRIAEALDLHYVYYPGSIAERDFGNAVLSRWPIVADRKLLLPSSQTILERPRICVVAVIASPFGPLAAYSVHNATPIVSLRGRLEQVDAIARHASRLGWPLIIGGDFNTLEAYSIAPTVERFVPFAIRWATEDRSATADYFFGSVRLDHVFVRDLTILDAGTVRTGASDHRALWVLLCPSTDRRGPRMTGFPCYTSGSTWIRSLAILSA